MRAQWWLAAISACYLARLAFYAAAFPLWEGFDEWAHFGVIRAVVAGKPLPPRDTRLPLDVAASLQYAPMPATLSNLPADAVTYEQFWSLSDAERRHREAEFQKIPREYAAEPSEQYAYEAFQPPFYYWLASPVLWLARSAGLAGQAMALRWFSILLATLIVPLVYLIARPVLDSERLALGCAAVVALMPGLAVDMARVSNECAAVVLFSAVVWRAVRGDKGWTLGLLLGLGLLTKAYLLAGLAGLLLILWAPRAFGLALVLSGWWYARNLWTTGTPTGTGESIAATRKSLFDMLDAADQLPWLRGVKSTLVSHFYYGGWSSLQAPRWMYYALALTAALAALGVLAQWRRGRVKSLVYIYALFWVAQLYHVMVIYATRGVATSMGWYLYAVIGAQAVLATAGLRRFFGGAAVWIGAGVFGVLDLYAMHVVALPYYTGLPSFRAGGVFARMTVFKPAFLTEPVLRALWVGYLAATVALIVSAVVLGREGVRQARAVVEHSEAPA